jgi:hypothetical protein
MNVGGKACTILPRSETVRVRCVARFVIEVIDLERFNMQSRQEARGVKADGTETEE